MRIGHELVESLDCELTDGPFGPMQRVDDLKQTSVPGVSMHHSLIAGLGA